MKRFLKLALSALVRAREKQAHKIALEQLDAHILRDIGFEQEAALARRRATRDRLLGTYC